MCPLYSSRTFSKKTVPRMEGTGDGLVRFHTFEWNDANNRMQLLHPGAPVMVWRKDSDDRNKDGGAHCEAIIEKIIIPAAVSEDNSDVMKNNQHSPDDIFLLRYPIDGSEYKVNASKLIRRITPNDAPVVIICRDTGSFRRQCWAQVEL